MKVKNKIFRNVIIAITVTLLLVSFRKVGIYFDDFNLSIYDVIIIVMSSLGLSKVNDLLAKRAGPDGK